MTRYNDRTGSNANGENFCRYKDEGWRGFMRGNGTNCIRIVPYSAVQFGSYNFYKKVAFLSDHYCVDDSRGFLSYSSSNLRLGLTWALEDGLSAVVLLA
jgi:hypothetical protein